MTARGSTITVVDSSPLPPSRPYDILMSAVETHAAIRDGAPYPGEQEAEAASESTLDSGASGGSRRVPRTKGSK